MGGGRAGRFGHTAFLRCRGALAGLDGIELGSVFPKSCARARARLQFSCSYEVAFSYKYILHTNTHERQLPSFSPQYFNAK